MKKLFLASVMLLVATITYASDVESVKEIVRVPLAVEYREKNAFKNIVGRFELDHNETISVVAFVRDPMNLEHVMALPYVFKITLKSKRALNNYYIEGVEQVLGVKISGTIDTAIETEPKIDFMLEGGVHLVNISKDGRNFRSEYIPKVNLGWEY